MLEVLLNMEYTEIKYSIIVIKNHIVYNTDELVEYDLYINGNTT